MLRDIQDELAQVLRDTIGDVLADDDIAAEIEPRYVMQPSTGICLDVYRADISRDSGSAGFGEMSGFHVFTVRARVTVADGNEAQDVLTDMADDDHPLSVAAAIESDQSLNGYTTQVVVDADSFSGLAMYPVGTAEPMLGCTWRVLVVKAYS